jgi:hypothetical protein
MPRKRIAKHPEKFKYVSVCVYVFHDRFIRVYLRPISLLFPDAELAEDPLQEVFGGGFSDHFSQGLQSRSQIDG